MLKNQIQLSILIILLAAFLLIGCTTVELEIVPSPSVVLPTTKATSIPTTNPTLFNLPTNEPTFQASPSPTVIVKEPTSTVSEFLDCGESFCSVPWQGYLSRPISEAYRNVIDPTYPYASTRNGELEVHHGVEFVNSSGTPVIAANDGTVVYAGNDAAEALGPYLGFYGNVVIIKHTSLYFGEDIYTLYAHLSQIDVEENEQVDLGQVIGKVGATGAALGSHLHFEVRVGINEESHTVNPILWFAPLAQADGEIMAIVAGRILDRNGQPVEALQLSFEKLGNDGKVEAYYYPITYHLSGVNYHPELNENFVVPDIPPGQYRLAFVYGGLYEFFITIEAGDLGFLTITLD